MFQHYLILNFHSYILYLQCRYTMIYFHFRYYLFFNLNSLYLFFQMNCSNCFFFQINRIIFLNLYFLILICFYLKFFVSNQSINLIFIFPPYWFFNLLTLKFIFFKFSIVFSLLKLFIFLFLSHLTHFLLINL